MNSPTCEAVCPFNAAHSNAHGTLSLLPPAISHLTHGQMRQEADARKHVEAGRGTELTGTASLCASQRAQTVVITEGHLE